MRASGTFKKTQTVLC